VNTISDISLVTRMVVMHDRRAFDTLVRKHQERIRRFFLSQTGGDSQLSDDLAQDTFIKAYTSIQSFRSLSGFSTWLYRIACNVLYDNCRRYKPTEDIDALPPLASQSTADSGARLDINAALGVLKADERLCITLQLMEGQSLERIAEITNMPYGTVKSHLSRGKTKLAKYLKENGYDR